jgi:Predicted membrane protein involved in D-alanine export
MMLLVFKYINFFLSSINSVFSLAGSGNHFNSLDIILPIGISFYIFQSLGYVIDVYRGTIKAEKNFFMYSLFVSFFPQIMSGPIGRASQLLPQLREEKFLDSKLVLSGLQLMLWGFFKKLVIANRLAVYVDRIYGNVDFFNGPSLLLASILYSIEIYCDFSGYTDIAIGVARVLGIKLMKNFDLPYFSSSISEFWRRWHISLSSWFRDYLYIPLGGNRVPKWRNLLNLLITFLVSGLWHGASWTFVIWGGLHGLYLIVEKLLSGKRVPKPRSSIHNRIYRILNILKVYVLVTFAWIFFRARSLHDALVVIGKIFNPASYSSSNLRLFWGGINFVTFNNTITYNVILILLIAALVVFFLASYFQMKKNKDLCECLADISVWKCFALNYLLVFIILFAGVFDSTQFIYVQF